MDKITNLINDTDIEFLFVGLFLICITVLPIYFMATNTYDYVCTNKEGENFHYELDDYLYPFGQAEWGKAYHILPINGEPHMFYGACSEVD